MPQKDVQIVKRPLRKQQGSDLDVKVRFWDIPEEEAYKAITTLVNTVDARQRGYWISNSIWAGLYDNIQRLYGAAMAAGGTGNLSNVTSPQSWEVSGSKLTYNVVRSCIDSATAKIAKNTPRPKFVTNEADWKCQRRAKLLTQYIDGLFYQSKVHEETVKMFRDACIFGTGALKVYVEPDTTNVRVECIKIVELTIDECDAVYGKPTQIHQKRQVARDKLLEVYGDKPELKEKIESCTAAPWLTRSVVDDVIVIESWHLPSGPNAKDGRHFITINNCTLESNEYNYNYFPFVFYKWGSRSAGFFGFGLTEELAGIQLKINKLVKQINAAQELMCIPRVFIEEGSNIAQHKLWDFGVIKYRGQPPQFSTSAAMPPEIYQSLENEIQRAYNITGISQLSAQSQKPAGLNSGVALREYQDINTERFATQGTAFTEAHLEIARIMIDISRDLYEDNKDLSVIGKVKGSKFIKKIAWKDVDLEDDQFIMTAFPVSQLPNTPEGRMQMIQELTQAGFLSHEQASELLQIPDIEDALSNLNAAYDIAAETIDNILSEGIYTPPEPFMNLDLTSKLAQNMYLRAELNGLGKDHPDRLDMLRIFLEQIAVLMEPPPPPPEAGIGAAPQLGALPVPGITPMAPLAVGAAPPVSPMLPFRGAPALQ